MNETAIKIHERRREEEDGKVKNTELTCNLVTGHPVWRLHGTFLLPVRKKKITILNV
jgi:hypothetical protein